MAQRQVYTESIVTLNGSQAESMLKSLKNQASEYRKMLIEAQKVGDTNQIKNLEKEISACESTQKKLRKETYNYNTVLKNINGSTLNQLNKASKSLYLQMKNLVKGTKEYAQTEKDLTKINRRIREIKKDYSEIAKYTPNKMLNFTLWSTFLFRISSISKSAALQAAQLDDVYADVMKTTELTHDEVVKLNNEFKKMDTRTSREALNILARDAGKLGITGTKDILAFVRAADKINVALGEDLGEGAIRNIGKMADVFGLTKKMGIENSFTAIGSSINALGQASTASESYLVDFTQRLAGAGAQAGISIQDILGYASAMDQSGIKVEMGATAFQKFIMNMYSDTATFAKYANMEVSEFADLLKNDANRAIIAVLKSLNEKDGFAALVPIFKDMGADGARAVSALSALATNIEAVTKAQKLSNEEFEKGTSLQNEFNVKNNNRQAQLEKTQKAIKDQVLLLGEKLAPSLINVNKGIVSIIQVVSKMAGVLLPISAYLLILITRHKLLAFWQQTCVNFLGMWNRLAITGKAISLLLSDAMARLTGNTIRAAAAQKLLKETWNSTVWGVIATVIVTIGIAIYKAIARTNELKKATKEFYKETEKAKTEADDLFKILEKNEKGSNLYKQALEKLKEQYGPYITNLIDENGYLTDIAVARSIVNAQIETTIGLKLKEEAISAITEKSINKQGDLYEKLVNRIMKAYGASESTARMVASQFVQMVKDGKNLNHTATFFYNTFEKRSRRVNQLLYSFGEEYSRYIDDLNNTNKKFDGLIPKENDFIGPIPLTDEQKKELRKKEKEKVQIAFEAAEKSLDQKEKEALNKLKKRYLNKEISQIEYQAQSEALTIQFLEQRNAIYIQYGKLNEDIESRLYDTLIKQQESAAKKSEEILKKLKKTIEDIEKETAKTVNDMLSSDASINIDIEDPALEAYLDYIKDMYSKAEAIKKEIEFKGLTDRYKAEKKSLDKLLSEQFITEKEYQEKLKILKLDYAEGIAKSVVSFTQAVSDLTSAIQDVELEKLESKKEQELTLYGDTADKRAEIENKYENKKLEIQKKYADIDMAIKIAQTIAAGALAAIQAYSQGGPYAGPILAAVVAATTALQVATIVAQRNAIKNTTTSTSTSSTTTGGRVPTSGYAIGGFTTKRSSDYTPVGVVHANEWVAPADMVREDPQLFASLERQRLSKTHITSPRRFAEGGYVETDIQEYSGNREAMIKFAAAVDKLYSNPIPAYVVLSEIQKKEALSNRLKYATSK